MKTALNYSQVVTVASTALTSLQTFGLFEFLNDVPGYTTELYTLYRYAKIHAVSVHIDIINNGGTPLTVAMAAVPDNSLTSSTTPRELTEARGSVYVMTGGSSAYNRATLKKLYFSENELGQRTFEKAHWITQAQAVSAAVRNREDPLIAVISQASDGVSSSSWILTYRCVYHVEWFSPVLPF